MTVDEIVKMAMIDAGEQNTNNYQRYLQWALNGYKKFNLHGFLPTTKCVRIDIDENTNTATLPDDYMEYLKIGLCVNGYMFNFRLNERICGTARDCCYRDEQLAEDIACCGTGNWTGDNWYYWPYQYLGNWYGGIYGQGAGTYTGGFRILDNTIYFDSYVTSTYFIMEYMSSGTQGRDTVIPDGFQLCLKNYIHYQRSIYSDVMTAAMRQMILEEYKTEALSFRARSQSIMLSDWRQTYLRSLKQTPKI